MKTVEEAIKFLKELDYPCAHCPMSGACDKSGTGLCDKATNILITSMQELQNQFAAVTAERDAAVEDAELMRKTAVEDCGMCNSEHVKDLIAAEKDGRLVMMDESVALAMYAGAHIIESDKHILVVLTHGTFLSSTVQSKQLAITMPHINCG